MGIEIQRLRGTTTQHNTFTGQVGVMTIDTTKWVCVVHDGTTAGGWAMSRYDHTHNAATESVAGFLSASDKTKLDGLTGGPTYYQTIQLNGTGQPQENIINLSTNFSSTDDSGGQRTTIDLSPTGVGNGVYTKVTVNSTGRITNGTTLVAADIPSLTASYITNLASTVQAYSLSTFAVPTADLSVNSHKIINLEDPVASTDAATKNYVDNIAVGLYFKAACRAASTANVNLAAPGSSIDTVSLSVGDRVLIMEQSNATTNGIYIFNGASSPMTRSLDAASGSTLPNGTFVFIGSEGAINGDTAWVLAAPGDTPVVVGTSNINFVQFSAGGSLTAGNGIQIISNAVSVKNVSSSRITVTSSGVDLATTGVTAGTYNNLTVDVYGRVTSASSVSYQAASSVLTGVAALTSGTGLVTQTGTGTFSNVVINPGTGISVTNPGGVAGNIGLAVIPNTTNQQVRVDANGTFTAQRPEINFIAGTGITITQTDNSGASRVDTTIAVSEIASGAPLGDEYILLSADATLTNSRVIVAGSGITLTDGGAGNNLTVALVTDLGTVP